MRTLVRLGDLNTKLKRFDRAIAWFNRAVVMKPFNGGVYNNLGSSYHHWGKYTELEQNYRQAIAQVPNYPVALNNLGNLLVEQGRFSEAVDCCKQVVALQPDHALAHRSLGFV